MGAPGSTLLSAWRLAVQYRLLVRAVRLASADAEAGGREGGEGGGGEDKRRAGRGRWEMGGGEACPACMASESGPHRSLGLASQPPPPISQRPAHRRLVRCPPGSIRV